MAWHGSDKPYSITYDVDFSHPDYNRTSDEHTEHFLTEEEAVRHFDVLCEGSNVQIAKLLHFTWEDRQAADPQGRVHHFKEKVCRTVKTYVR